MDHPSKLLLIGNYLSGPRFNKNAWQDLAAHLRASGHAVITCSDKQNKLLRLLDMLATIWTRKGDYQLAQMDVFSGPAFTWAYLSGLLLKKLNKPFVLTLHGGNLPEFSCRYERKVRMLLKSANAVTVPSKYLLERMQIYRNDLQLIPNAVEKSKYPFVERTNPAPRLIWLRAFHEIYNPEMAIETLKFLNEQFHEITLTMVGPDKGDGSLQATKKLASEYALQDLIEFPGGVEKADVPVWLNKGDIFLNTTNYDNTPISVIEAMACGLCIVSTNVGGLPYLLEDGVDALLVPPNDPKAMAAAVRRILTEPGLAEKLSKNAREKAAQFDWSIILPQWERLINSIK